VVYLDITNTEVLTMTNVEDIDKYQLEIRNLEKQMNIKFEYNDRTVAAELKRLDAIRVVDGDAVILANEKIVVQAELLAGQVVASTEALRNLISSTNIAITQQLSQVSTQLTERIAVLEKIQYENEGRSKLSVPLLMMISGGTGGVIVFIVQKLMGL
jgi:hypothetical protein